MERQQGFAKIVLIAVIAGAGFFAWKERAQIEQAWSRYNMTPAQRGAADMQRMRFDLAQKSFEQSVADNPMDPMALYSLGWALQAQGKDNEALSQYGRAAALAKNQPDLQEKIYTNSGAIYVKQRNFEDAAESYRLALTVNPNQTDSRYQYALILLEKGQAPEALEQFKTVLQLDPAHAAAANQLARLKAEAKASAKKVGRKTASTKIKKVKPSDKGKKGKPAKAKKRKT